jgi:hypothetical protein
MHQRHANHRNIWKIVIANVILVLSCFIVCAEENMTVMPDHLLYISIKGTDTLSVEDTWVTINREGYVFPVDRFAEEFKMSGCENKYYYEVETPDGSVYWNHFCPIGTLIWDGALTTEEDINFKQDTTDLVLPFFDEAESIDILDEDGKTVLSIPLKGYGKSMPEAEEAIAVLEEPSDQLTQERVTPAEEDMQPPEQIEAHGWDEYAILKISGGLLLLVILIAIFILRIKNAR